MFLNKMRCTILQSMQTLRFKLTAGMSMFLIVLLSMSIALTGVLQWLHLSKNIDARLHFFVEEFESEYLSGEELKSTCHMISLDKIPDLIHELLQQNIEHDETVFFSLNDSNLYFFFTMTPSGSCKEYEINELSGETIVYNRDGVDRIQMLNEAFNSESYGEDNEDIVFVLYSSDRKILARSVFDDSRFASLNTLSIPKNYMEAECIDDINNGKIQMRFLSRRLLGDNILVIGYSKEKMHVLLAGFLCNSAITTAVAFLVSILLGWNFAGRLSRGIERVAEASRKIEAGNYSLRLEAGNEFVELQRLVSAFNAMINRTEHLLNDLRTVADNIAHDLRTPLTRLSGKAELALYSNQYQDLPGDVQEECTSMITMINTMLEITQTENRFEVIEKEKFNFAELVRQLAELFSTAAEDRNIALKLEIAHDPVMFYGVKVKFSRVLANLLDNALKFTPRGGSITLGLKLEGDKIIMTVADTGCGIDPGDLNRIFSRFFRADSSRSLPGNGLGLSLVKAIVEAADGTISISSKLGQGTMVVVSLPMGTPSMSFSEKC